MNRGSRSILGALLALSALVAQGQTDTVAEMLPSCRLIKLSSANTVSVPPGGDQCWGAFSVMQSGTTWIDAEKKRIWQACVPAGATRFQLIAIFIQYVDQRPQRWHEGFSWVALESLQIAFPCPP